MKFFLHSSQVWRKIDSTVLTALPNECANWMYWLGANLSKKVGAPWEQDGSTTMGAGDLVAVRAGVRTGGVEPPPPSPLPQSVLGTPAVTNSSSSCGAKFTEGWWCVVLVPHCDLSLLGEK